MTLDALCSANDVLIYDTFNAAATSTSFLFGNAGAAAAVGAAPASASPAPPAEPAAEAEEKQQGRRKRRRRTRSCKNREDAESQRMTHIAVERNRRRQMNEYLAVLRSLMPDCYVHRGDQASIVGGAIDFVKELEQLLQSLEAQKRTLMQMQMRTSTSTTTTTTASGMESTSNCTEEACDMGAPPFAQFFTYPQYVWCHAPRDSAAAAPPSLAAENRSGVADIEVSLIETHANLRIMSPRRPGQLVKMVAGLQALRLAVLHLNVTTLDSLVLYFISVKVEEGCSLTTVDDIAAAVHHVLCIIGAEAASQQLLAGPSAVTSSDL